MKVADTRQLIRHVRHGAETRRKDQVMHFARTFMALIDTTDLGRQHEPDLGPAGCGNFGIHRSRQLRLQAIESRFGRFEFFLKFGEPGGMRKVSCSDNGNPLKLRPAIETLRDHVPADGSGIAGMNVEIGDE